MDKEKAVKEIAKLVQAADKAISKAEKLATEHELNFTISLGTRHREGDRFFGNPKDYWLDFNEAGWVSSTQSCNGY